MRLLHDQIPMMAGLTVTALLCCGATAVSAQSGPHGVLAQHTLSQESSRHWRLPSRLEEISGLALTGDQRLLAVDDEQAIVYELDYERGRLVKAFAFGEPTLRGDFEGIAWLAGRVYLVTSDGVLYSAGEGADGERVPFREHRTGLGRDCEIEGLAAEPAAASLRLLCKRALAGSDPDKLLIFRWSVSDETVEWPRRIELPHRAIVAALGSGGLHPSGIVQAARGQHWLIVAAREKAIVEITAEGALVEARRLPMANRHRQPEGIELLADGRLLIADEGGGSRAQLAIYQPDTSGDRQYDD